MPEQIEGHARERGALMTRSLWATSAAYAIWRDANQHKGKSWIKIWPQLGNKFNQAVPVGLPAN